jgi:hypothetical protein
VAIKSEAAKARKRELQRAYQKARRAAHPEIIKEYEGRRDKGKRNAQRRAAYHRHAEKIKARMREKYWANRDAMLEAQRKNRKPDSHRRSMLRRYYGMSVEQFAAMRDAQGGGCGICREPFTKTPHVDHDHATGTVRELLCGPCNTGLGRFRDDPERMEAAAAYIRKHRAPALTLVKEA